MGKYRIFIVGLLAASSTSGQEIYSGRNEHDNSTILNLNLIEHISHVKFQDYDCVIISPISSMVPWQNLQNIMGHLPARYLPKHTTKYGTFDHEYFLKSTCPDSTIHPYVGKIHTYEKDGEIPYKPAKKNEKATYRAMFDLVRNNWREGYEECPFGTLAVLILDVLCGGDQEAWDRLEDSWSIWIREYPVYFLATSRWNLAFLLGEIQIRTKDRHTNACDFHEDMHSKVVPVIDEFLTPMRMLPGFLNNKVEKRLNEFMSNYQNTIEKEFEKFVPDPRCPPSALTMVAMKVLSALRKYPAMFSFAKMIRHLNHQFTAIPLQFVLFSSWPVFPIIQSFGSMAWRSHGVFNSLRTEHYLWVLNTPEFSKLTNMEPQADTIRTMSFDNRREILERTKNDHPSSFCKMVANWILENVADNETITVTAGFSPFRHEWLQGYLRQAAAVGIENMIFLAPNDILIRACLQMRPVFAGRLLCLMTTADARQGFGPHDLAIKGKFELLPFLLLLSFPVVWLDLDIFLVQNPIPHLQEIADKDNTDLVLSEHFTEYCINNGIFYAKPSDRVLVWFLRYLQWMHDYPFGHDQNGMDAFVNHSIQEPYVQLKTEPVAGQPPMVNYSLMDVERSFPICQGAKISDHFGHVNTSDLVLIHLCMCIDKDSHLSSIFNTSLDMTSTEQPLTSLFDLNSSGVQDLLWMLIHKGNVVKDRPKSGCFAGVYQE